MEENVVDRKVGDLDACIHEQRIKGAMWVLWPAFVMAGVAETVFFSLFDPADLALNGEPVNLSRVAVYSIGFLLFWGFAAGSSALTCFLQSSPYHINKYCPLVPGERPLGCPKREEPDGRVL